MDSFIKFCSNNFNTLKLLEKKLLVIFILSVVVLIGSVWYIRHRQKLIKSSAASNNVISSGNLSLAYGPQRHLFRVSGQSTIVVFVKDDKVSAAFSSGDVWKQYPNPLFDETTQLVGAAFEGNRLHMVAESNGKILYRKVSLPIQNDQISLEGWVFSPTITLDDSGLARRPTIEVVDTNPIVAWSFETLRLYPFKTAIRVMTTKGDSSDEKNWCDFSGQTCGHAARGFTTGVSEEVYHLNRRIPITPILIKVNEQKVGLWFFDKETKKLKRLFLTKNGQIWTKSDIAEEAIVGGTTVANFDLSGVYDASKNRALLAFQNHEGMVNVIAVTETGTKQDLSWDGNRLGANLSLTTSGGKIFLFLTVDKKLVYRQYEEATGWTLENVLSPDAGNLITLASETGTVTPADTQVVIITTEENGSYSLEAVSVKQPVSPYSPTASPTTPPPITLTPLPTDIPQLSLTETPVTVSPTLEISPTTQ